jgi:hypothetical protein
VQTFVTDPTAQVDAIVEISFDDEAAMRAALDSDAYLEHRRYLARC